MKPICIKGRKISKFLIQTDKVTLPMLDTKYLEMLPLYKEAYCNVRELSNNHYELLKFVFII
jgi:hypothetical protein